MAALFDDNALEGLSDECVSGSGVPLTDDPRVLMVLTAPARQAFWEAVKRLAPRKLDALFNVNAFEALHDDPRTVRFLDSNFDELYVEHVASWCAHLNINGPLAIDVLRAFGTSYVSWRITSEAVHQDTTIITARNVE